MGQESTSWLLRKVTKRKRKPQSPGRCTGVGADSPQSERREFKPSSSSAQKRPLMLEEEMRQAALRLCPFPVFTVSASRVPIQMSFPPSTRARPGFSLRRNPVVAFCKVPRTGALVGHCRWPDAVSATFSSASL